MDNIPQFDDTQPFEDQLMQLIRYQVIVGLLREEGDDFFYPSGNKFDLPTFLKTMKRVHEIGMVLDSLPRDGTKNHIAGPDGIWHADIQLDAEGTPSGSITLFEDR